MATKLPAKQAKPKPRPRGKRGPEAERVKIKGEWEETLKKALEAPPHRKDTATVLG
jgi:hypothetical protein